MQNTNSNLKTVYSFRIKNLLEIRGFKPILETDNPKVEGYKCWIFEETPAFLEVFEEVVSKKGGH